MNPTRIALVAILAGWAPMLHAQSACLAQIQPIRPVSAGPKAALLCLCAQNNTGCHWQWASAPLGRSTQPAPVQSDTSIYRITPPSQAQPMSPLDMAIKAEEIRALRLENQQRQQEIQHSQSPAAPAAIPDPASVPSSQSTGLVLGAPKLPGGADSFPPRWKSLTTATTKIIRREEERIYVETVVPDAQRQAGCFMIADLHRQGSIFAGATKSSCVCQYGANKSNRFSHDSAMEITMVSPTRIEGRTLQPAAGAKFDCKHDTYSKPNEWVSFAWIPE